MRSFTAGKNEDGMRLSRFVLRVTTGLPEPLMHRQFRNRRIKVNGRRAAPDARLCEGDVVELYINDEFFPAGSGAGILSPKPTGRLPHYATVYEDDAVAILYKPQGMLSHRDASGKPTLLDAFTNALAQRGAYDPASENTFAPTLCNRLDYGTEGLVLAAKTAAALRDGNEIIRLYMLEKTYLCICVGTPPEGRHTAWHRRDHATKTVQVFAVPGEDTKEIITGVKVLGQAGGYSWCEVQLLTGRTHQIRAHLAYLGAPIAGDAKYGGQKNAAPLPGLAGPALCAWRLTFGDTLPEGSSLTHLAGRQFTAGMARLTTVWAKLQRD